MRYIILDPASGVIHAQAFDGLSLCGHTAADPLVDGTLVTRFDSELGQHIRSRVTLYRSYVATWLCKTCAKLLAKRSDVQITRDTNRLYQIDVSPDPERVARYVQVQDSSTDRQYYLRVPPGVTKADAGVAWTFGLEMSAYQPVQEA